MIPMLRLLVSLAASCMMAPGWTLAEKNYGPGVTDTEIKIGQTFPYSGPISAYTPLARTEAAYFDKINAESGVNGRKIRLISLDDAYEPPKTVEQTRRLIESEEVLLLFNPLGASGCLSSGGLFRGPAAEGCQAERSARRANRDLQTDCKTEDR
jgi:branched-chain amino acid transport system substrate-binding protein